MSDKGDTVVDLSVVPLRTADGTVVGPTSPVSLGRVGAARWEGAASLFGTPRRPGQATAQAPRPFHPKPVPPGVVPRGVQLAMDAAQETFAWADSYGAGQYYAYAEGLEFLGYPALAQMAQRPEYRRIVEVTATEMTRRWVRLTVGRDAGEKSKDRLQQIEDEMARLDVRGAFRRVAEQDGFYGRAHLYLDTGDAEESDPSGTETATSIGDGTTRLSASKVNPDHPLRALRTIEAVWTYPTEYNSNAPWREDWYRPSVWYAMGRRFHATRLLPFIGREVPDLLKPAYSFGGLALTQMVKPYVDNWLQTRQSVNDIVSAFSQMILKTDLSEMVQSAGQETLYQRLNLFTQLRNNRGVMVLDKEAEEFSNVSASLAGLHELQAASQEHMASVSGIPVVKLLGIQPSGLNASSEGELRTFYDWINDTQEALFRPNLTVVLRFIQLSLFGEVDPAIDFEFNPLWALDEQQQSQVDLAEAQTDQVLIDSGVLSPEEVRARVVAKPGSPYADLDPEQVPDLAEEELEGLQPEGGRPNEAAELAEEDELEQAQDAAWEESKHPRTANGQFGEGGGRGSGATESLRSYIDPDSPNHAHKINVALASGKLSEEQRAVVRDMDDLISRAPKFDGSRRLYRGMTNFTGSLKRETIIRGVGYASTSEDRDSALAYAEGGRGGVLLEITCEAGTQALSTAEFDTLFGGGEREYILPRGAAFVVDRVRSEGGLRVAEVRYIGTRLTPEQRDVAK